MVNKQRILVVEDEEAIRTGLVDVFLFHGFDVDCAADGDSGLRMAMSGQYDLLLLDVMLPGTDGFSICDRVRSVDREQPIILLTARSADEDVIHGLKLGADDYVPKPFSVTELVLRVQAVLRRSQRRDEDLELLQLGQEISIDLSNMSGHHGEREMQFTRRECELLRYLAEHSRRPVSRAELLHKVWGYARNADLETRTVDIHVAKLRRKIEPDPASPRFLETVRGAGYRLNGIGLNDG